MAQNNRITITNNEFTIGGKRIWFNGVNTPWNKWNDFGGNYDDRWWNNHFAELHKAGVNSTRVWINCNNDQGAVDIDENGMVTGVSAKHWDDLAKLFEAAERHQIYIMATPLSFDHFKDTGTRPEAQKWRNMLLNKKSAESFAQNYIVPFLQKFGHNPRLWSIDLMNEPDWVNEGPECGRIPWENISYLFAVCASVIHEHSNVLVTVGINMPKYSSDEPPWQGNKISDEYLQKLYPCKRAYVDFWSPHYYDWMGDSFGVPFYMSPYGPLPAGFGMCKSKPALIGECMARGSAGRTEGTENNTIVTDYKEALRNGWQGVMPWTSNGVDGCGDLSHLSPATIEMAKEYGGLIFP
ncbi:MAG: cellulase family glycosylhydrolase [Firmicutes bacterium]|nr:cellulase family glycosylhydrolase [Bacillota bacterium]